MVAADVMAWEDLDGRFGARRADADMAAVVLADASDHLAQRMAAGDWLVRNSSPGLAAVEEDRVDVRRFASGMGDSGEAP